MNANADLIDTATAGPIIEDYSARYFYNWNTPILYSGNHNRVRKFSDLETFVLQADEVGNPVDVPVYRTICNVSQGVVDPTTQAKHIGSARTMKDLYHLIGMRKIGTRIEAPEGEDAELPNSAIWIRRPDGTIHTTFSEWNEQALDSVMWSVCRHPDLILITASR